MAFIANPGFSLPPGVQLCPSCSRRRQTPSTDGTSMLTRYLSASVLAGGAQISHSALSLRSTSALPISSAATR